MGECGQLLGMPHQLGHMPELPIQLTNIIWRRTSRMGLTHLT